MIKPVCDEFAPESVSVIELSQRIGVDYDGFESVRDSVIQKDPRSGVICDGFASESISVTEIS